MSDPCNLLHPAQFYSGTTTPCVLQCECVCDDRWKILSSHEGSIFTLSDEQIAAHKFSEAKQYPFARVCRYSISSHFYDRRKSGGV